MKLQDMSIEELEVLSYTDLTYMLIKENKKAMNTPTLFKEICNLLDYSDDDYSSKIGDYYTSLTIDKRFILLDNNEWDIRDNHSIKIEVDDDSEDENIDEEIEDTEDDVEVEDSVQDDMDTIEDDIDTNDDIDDLVIISDEEIEEE